MEKERENQNCFEKKNVEWSKDNDPEIYVRVMVFLLATKV